MIVCYTFRRCLNHNFWSIILSTWKRQKLELDFHCFVFLLWGRFCPKSETFMYFILFERKTKKFSIFYQEMCVNTKEKILLKNLYFYFCFSLQDRKVFYMGTVICHPTSEIANQCTKCLPTPFGKRGNCLCFFLSVDKLPSWNFKLMFPKYL